MRELVAALKEAYCLAQGRELLAEQIIEEHFKAAAMGVPAEPALFERLDEASKAEYKKLMTPQVVIADSPTTEPDAGNQPTA